MADDQQPQKQQGGQNPIPPGQGTPPPQGPAPGQAQPTAGTPPGQPPAGTPPGQSGPFPPGGAQPPPPPPEDKTPANYQIGKHLPDTISVAIPAHKLQFDEQLFLRLLAGSISLTKDEKKRIVNSIPKLKQEQVDELIRIFEEEKRKFAELSKKHVPQLEKLEKQHWADWQDIELEQKAETKKGTDEAEAAEIRKKLGL